VDIASNVAASSLRYPARECDIGVSRAAKRECFLRPAGSMTITN
jgi:hypothetical protein